MSVDDNKDWLLTGLTPEQYDAVTTSASPLCIIAGAGSGKTRVLTRRIAWQISQGNILPQQVLAVTFTRRAAREMRSRLRRLRLRDQVKAGTFHAIALSQLRHYNTDRGRNKPLRLLNHRTALISELLQRHTRQRHTRTRKPDTGNESRAGHSNTATARTSGTSRTGAATIANEITWARARLVTPEGYPETAATAGRIPPFGDASQFAEIYAEYEKAKRGKRVLDFDDVLADCLELMLTQPKHAKAQRWLHQHLLVDEFQDINPLQFALLQSWLGEDSTLVLVGDPDQAIYGWNGADPNLIDEVDDHFPGCAVVTLRTNFRSTPEILAAAGRLLDKAPQPAFKASGKPPTVTLVDEDEEPVALARAVRNRQPPGAPWRLQAVLTRTNAQLKPLLQALKRQGIPASVRHGQSVLKQPEIVDLINDWQFQGKHEDANLATCAADTRMSLLAPYDALREDREFVWQQEFTWQKHATHMGRRAIEALKIRIRDFLDFVDDHLLLNPDATVGSFSNDMGFDDFSWSRRDSVDLLTFHAAKGLEWPIVHLVGLEDGYLPIAGTRTHQARAEEQRLLYVAATRALQELHIMWCDQRTFNGRTVERKPSPWLTAFHPTDSDPDSDFDVKASITQARRALQGVKPTSVESSLHDHDHDQLALPF